jgi:hypothetical protein
MRELTKIEYWDRGYVARNETVELKFDWRNYIDCLIAGKTLFPNIFAISRRN